MRRRWFLAVPAAAVFLAGLGAAAYRPAGQDERGGAKRADRTKEPRLVDTEAFLREYDDDKDGRLTKAELPAWLHHNFARLDANKDGKLSAEELEKGAAYLNQRRRPSDVIAVLVEMSDCDECCVEEVQRAYEALRKLDGNRDGKIDADELKGGRALLIQERVDGLFKDLDKDKDGKLSQSEARGQVRAHFADLDTNKDGVIDRAELAAGASAKPEGLDKSAPRKK